MNPEVNDVAAPTPGVTIDGRYDVVGLVFDNAAERPSVAEPRRLHIELIDSRVKKRVKLYLGFTARFDDVRLHP